MEAALPNLPMAETVMVRLIRIVGSGMTDFFEPLFRRLDLTENSFHVLCLLMASENGIASPSELSELIGTSRANMTRILESLESDNLVSRALETRDARRHAIQITPKGRKVAKATVPQMIEPLKRAFSDLSPEELILLDRLLRKAILSFDKGAHTLRAVA